MIQDQRETIARIFYCNNHDNRMQEKRKKLVQLDSLKHTCIKLNTELKLKYFSSAVPTCVFESRKNDFFSNKAIYFA